jgi:transposase
VRHRWTTTELTRIRALAAGGATIGQIAVETGLRRSLVEYAIRRLAAKTNPAAHARRLPVPPWWWRGVP